MLFSIFSTIFLDTRRMSRHFRHSSRVEKYVKKISTSTQKKKNARLNFISARQHSQQTYINSYSTKLANVIMESRKIFFRKLANVKMESRKIFLESCHVRLTNVTILVHVSDQLC